MFRAHSGRPWKCSRCEKILAYENDGNLEIKTKSGEGTAYYAYDHECPRCKTRNHWEAPRR